MDIGKFIAHVITIGLALGALGTLGEVTHALRDKAADTQRRGMVSLGKFNRRLIHGR